MTNTDFLLVVFQRGGADGLCELAFYNDSEYTMRRTHPGTRLEPHGSSIAPAATFLPQPSQTNPAHPHATGLAPAMLALKPAYDAGELAFVHATGTIDTSRSHFDQQSLMERAEVEHPMTSPNLDGFGWLRRHLQTPGLPGYGNGFRALSITAPPVDSLVNAPAYLPVLEPASFSFPTRGPAQDPALAQRVQMLDARYTAFGNPLQKAFDTDQQALTDLQTAFGIPYSGTVFPNSDFGKHVRDAAHLAKHLPDLEIVALNIGGWDTHQNQGVTYDPANGATTLGAMDLLMKDLADSLEAFRQDLAGSMRGYCVVVMSEFGRTLDSNSSNGTDHGRGGVCMLMGPRVNGGQVLLPSSFAGLPTNGDLDVGCDIRHVQGEIAIDILGHTTVDAVLPGLGGHSNWVDPMLIT